MSFNAFCHVLDGALAGLLGLVMGGDGGFKSLPCWVSDNMEIYSPCKQISFLYQKNEQIARIDLLMAAELLFCCFASNSKLRNLFQFLWNILLNQNIKAMTIMRPGGLLMKIVLFASYYFSKKLILKKLKNIFAH